MSTESYPNLYQYEQIEPYYKPPYEADNRNGKKQVQNKTKALINYSSLWLLFIFSLVGFLFWIKFLKQAKKEKQEHEEKVGFLLSNYIWVFISVYLIGLSAMGTFIRRTYQ